MPKLSSPWLLSTLLLVTATVLVTLPIWKNLSFLGISDWDYYFSYHQAARNIVLEENSFPFWNPFICGGTAGLADPEFPLFTPTFLLELIFGIPIGLRLAIILATASGAVGWLMLARQLKLTPLAGLAVALGASFGSVNLLEIVEGHPNIFAAAYIPWVLWVWHRAYARKSQVPSTKFQTNRKFQTQNKHNRHWSLKNWKLPAPRSFSEVGKIGNCNPWSLLTGLLLALMFYQGGIYLLMYFAFVFLAIILVSRNKKRALAITAASGLWALGFAALKIVPVLLWLRHFPDEMYASSPYTLPYLHEILLERHLHGAKNVFPGQEAGWHEYGAYVGPVLAALAAASLLLWRRSRIIKWLLLGTFAAAIVSATGPFLKPFFDANPWLPRSNISRVIIWTVIGLSVLAGFTVNHIQRKAKKGTLLAAIVVSLIAIDLLSLAHNLMRQPFVIPPYEESISPAPYPIAYTIHNYPYRLKGENDRPGEGTDYTRAYTNIQNGYGSLAYCSVLGPSPVVSVVETEDSQFLTLTGAGSAKLINWKPNRITVSASLPESSELIVNANYAPGWQVSVNGQVKPAKDNRNRLAATLPPGEHTVTFFFRNEGFYIGLTITIIAITTAVIASFGKVLGFSKVRQSSGARGSRGKT